MKILNVKAFSFFLLILLFILMVNIRLSAQNNLQYYLSAALRNSPAIKENQSSIQIIRLDRQLNNAEFSLPQVSLTANYLFAPYFNNNELVTTAPQPTAIGYDASVTNGGLYSAQVNLSKNIFNSGLTNAYDMQTGLQITSTEHAIQTVKHNLEKDITDQYILTYQAEELYYLSEALIDTVRQQLDLTRALMLRGLAKQSDYLLLKVELANQEIASLEALSSYKTNLYELNTSCGITDTALVELTHADLKKRDPVNESNFLRKYSIDSMLIVSRQKVLETKYLPQLSIFANAGLNAVELTGIQRKFGISAGLNFSYPIFDGGQRNITRQQSAVSADILGLQKVNQRVTIQNKKNETSSQLSALSRNMNAINGQIKDYEQIIRLSRSELRQGQLTMIEFITILRNFLDLKKTEIQTYTNYQQAINQFNYWNW